MIHKPGLRSALVAVCLVISAISAAWAQNDIGARIREASRALTFADSPIGLLDEQQRERVVEFVAGNALFTLSHEFGHVVISDFSLPVLGREEDAADAFATLALLHVGTDFTHGVLVDAARGLLLLGERERRMGLAPAFYDEHGLNPQRAYAIVCLMVGSNPSEFRDLARRAALPEERQETCQIDFDQARTSWMRLLEPHLRASSRPSFWERLFTPRARLSARAESSVEIAYSDAPSGLAAYRELLRTVRLLEEVRNFAAKNFNLPRRLTIEARACGKPDAYWDPQERRVVLCYEFLAFHADLALRP